MKRHLALLLALSLAAPAVVAQQEDTRLELTWQKADAAGAVLIRNATIWTQDEAGILENADILFDGGTIVAVGTGLEAPDGATVIDGTGRHVTPGIIDAHSHTGSFGSRTIQVAQAMKPRHGAVAHGILGGIGIFVADFQA